MKFFKFTYNIEVEKLFHPTNAMYVGYYIQVELSSDLYEIMHGGRVGSEEKSFFLEDFRKILDQKPQFFLYFGTKDQHTWSLSLGQCWSLTFWMVIG